MRFRTTLAAPSDGKGTFAMIHVQRQDGEWIYVDRTRTYQMHPSMVRARSAATAMIRTYAKRHHGGIFTLVQE